MTTTSYVSFLHTNTISTLTQVDMQKNVFLICNAQKIKNTYFLCVL